MKRYLLGAVAVGLTLVGVWACGSSNENDSLCGEEGGFCTAASSCSNVLPFGCGNGGDVCCANGTANPGPVNTNVDSAAPADEDSGLFGSVDASHPDSSVNPITDSGANPTKDSGTGTATDSGTKDSGPVQDSGPKDAAKG